MKDIIFQILLVLLGGLIGLLGEVLTKEPLKFLARVLSVLIIVVGAVVIAMTALTCWLPSSTQDQLMK